MAKLKNFLTNWWTVSVLIVVLLLLVFCLGLPLVASWFRPWWVQTLLAVLIVGGWGTLAFLRVRKARRAQQELVEGIGGGGASSGEEQVQAQRMGEALASLKQASGKRRDYLYSRPWYVIIGPPGSGKTTALLNSGLRFPFSDQSMRGVGGTRNLDFWFADEAVMIDTAGRYTSQDSDAAADSKAWHSFLSLLKRNRPLQPVNGIIVAIGADELLRADRQAIDAHAGAIRRRLAEIRAGLEVAAPIYLMVTKADLLAGFVEFFEDLDVEGRRAVLGHTFRFADGAPTPDGISAAFDEIAQAVADRQAKRLAEEADPLRRGLILGFPAQLTTMRSRLVRLLEGAFASRDLPGGILRGIYFTSGVQHGAPLDRLLAGMADVYDQPRSEAQGSGKAYFLNRLLGEVMFPESGLVQMDPKARLRLRSRLVGAIGGIAALALLTVIAWGVSTYRNMALQDDLLKQAQAAAEGVRQRGVDLRQVSSSDADLEEALPVLDELRALSQGYGDQQAGGPPWSMRFGLFQSGHAAKADEAYRDALRRILLPRLILRAENVINENLASPLAVYEPLKVYLMLGGERPGGIDAGAVKAWAKGDWASASYPGPDRADLRKRLGLHLDALLTDPNMASVWPGRKAPLDGNVVMTARIAVQSLTVAERAYAILRQKAMAQAGAPWAAANIVTSGDAAAFSNGPGVLQLQVPYFFTREGFEKIYQPGLLSVQKDLEADLWVLGSDADTASVRQQIASVRPGVAGAYAREYIAQWEGVVKAMTPGAFFSDLAAFGAFTKSPSPWKLLLGEVRKNTSFTGGTTAAKNMVTAKITQKLGNAAQLVPTGASGMDAGSEISNYFRDLSAYVGDGKAPAPVDEFITAVRSAGQAVIAGRSSTIGGAGDAVQAQMAQATAAVQAAGATAPALLQPFVSETAKGGSSAQTSAVQGAVSQAYADTVLPACKGVVQDRYPFFAASKDDASVADVIRFVGNGGMMDGFVRDRLMPMMDTAGPVWRWRMDDPVGAMLDPASAEQFAEVPAIRDLLLGGLPYKVSLDNMGAGVDAIEFGAGGTSYRFDRNARGDKAMQWLPQAGAPEAHVTFFSGGQQVDEVAEQGPWALFRLMDKARRKNNGETQFLATFGSGDRSATLRISLASNKHPFNRGSIWTFRCPTAL